MLFEIKFKKNTKIRPLIIWNFDILANGTKLFSKWLINHVECEWLESLYNDKL